MTGARDITQLCCSPNLAGIVANKIEQKFLFCLFLFWNRVNRTRPKAPIWKAVYCGVIMASVAHQHVHFGHQSFVGQALDVGRSLAQTVQDLGGAGGGGGSMGSSGQPEIMKSVPKRAADPGPDRVKLWAP